MKHYLFIGVCTLGSLHAADGTQFLRDNPKMTIFKASGGDVFMGHPQEEGTFWVTKLAGTTKAYVESGRTRKQFKDPEGIFALVKLLWEGQTATPPATPLSKSPAAAG